MNHPKGEESTGVGESCSSRITCPQKLCTAAERAPTKLRPGRTFPKGRNLCGGFRPFLRGEPMVPHEPPTSGSARRLYAPARRSHTTRISTIPDATSEMFQTVRIVSRSDIRGG